MEMFSQVINIFPASTGNTQAWWFTHVTQILGRKKNSWKAKAEQLSQV